MAGRPRGVSKEIIRERILTHHKYRYTTKERARIGIIDHPVKQEDKTPLMTMIEWKFNRPISELVWEDSLPNIAEKLEVSCGTVSKWRRQFPLEKYRRGANNRKLPFPKSS